MSYFKKMMKSAMKQALAPKPARPAPDLPLADRWSEAVRKHRGVCAFFWRPSDQDAWHIAVPESLLISAKEDGRRKSARILEVEDIYDSEELADRKQEIKDDILREDYESDAEWKEDIKSEMDALAAEIKWSDMMIIVPVRKRSGEQIAIAVREKDAKSIGQHELCPGEEVFVFETFADL